jgi:hypothetical protein
MRLESCITAMASRLFTTRFGSSAYFRLTKYKVASRYGGSTCHTKVDKIGTFAPFTPLHHQIEMSL